MLTKTPRVDKKPKYRLYGKNAQQLDSSVFGEFRLLGKTLLKQVPQRANLALAFRVPTLKHMALVWYADDDVGLCGFIPGDHPILETKSIMRLEFPSFMPTPTLFRVLNEDNIYDFEL
jgi:hypothetical protein